MSRRAVSDVAGLASAWDPRVEDILGRRVRAARVRGLARRVALVAALSCVALAAAAVAGAVFGRGDDRPAAAAAPAPASEAGSTSPCDCAVKRLQRLANEVDGLRREWRERASSPRDR